MSARHSFRPTPLLPPSTYISSSSSSFILIQVTQVKNNKNAKTSHFVLDFEFFLLTVTKITLFHYRGSVRPTSFHISGEVDRFQTRLLSANVHRQGHVPKLMKYCELSKKWLTKNTRMAFSNAHDVSADFAINKRRIKHIQRRAVSHLTVTICAVD